jgi:thiol-disulfide isomerase/thioredoxin
MELGNTQGIIKGIVSDRMSLLMIVMAVLIVLFGGYALTGYLVGEPSNTELSDTQNPDVLEPVDSNPEPAGITTFIDSGQQACLEAGKPVIRLFSTTWCPHCTWVSDTFESTVNEYVEQGRIVARHWELDINDDTLTPEAEGAVPQEELAIYQQFNPRGSIPTFVFGCKYYRIGNGHERQGDLAAEEAEFRAVIEALL